MGVRVVTGTARVTALTAALGGALLVGVAAVPAHAHDTLVSTSPANGTEVARVPATVKLTFNEPVLGLGTAVVVDGPNGPAQVGKVAVVDESVSQNLASGSPPGAYTVRWRATSSDGHPITGTFGFTAKASNTSTNSTTTPSPTTTPTTTANAAADPKKSGDDTNWAAVLIWGAAGAAIGAGYVLFRRRKNKDEA